MRWSDTESDDEDDADIADIDDADDSANIEIPHDNEPSSNKYMD